MTDKPTHANSFLWTPFEYEHWYQELRRGEERDLMNHDYFLREFCITTPTDTLGENKNNAHEIENHHRKGSGF
ncbi:hypothetical protein ACULN0_10660 [Pectobacterium actinidiae]|uniref:hypothetical protein n=1 Tax=Pectobacterium actinidiae TaxID=1507808 RepID=UPI00404097A8